MVIVKTNNGHVFGGAADKSWASLSGGAYFASPAAFVFCISCAGAGENDRPSQLKRTGQHNNQHALRHSPNCGPVSSGGTDLRRPANR